MPGHEIEQSYIPHQETGGERVSRTNFPWKPQLFDVAHALEAGEVRYADDGTVRLNKPEITGEEEAVVPTYAQFPVIRQTYDDLFSVVSAVANSPKLPNGQSLQEYVGEAYDRYYKGLDEALEQGLPEARIGNFLYDPRTRSLAIVAPSEIHYLALRTSNSMYEDPQARPLLEIWQLFRDSKFAFAGASVGGNILEGVVRNIGPKKVKIADFDPASAGNITRLNRGNVFHLSNPRSERGDPMNAYEDNRPTKASLQAREMLLIDPYMDIDVYEEALADTNINEFLEGVDVIVEAVDNLDVKIKLRKKARENGIPLLMTSDVDSRVFVDFYDYRKNPDLPLVHGVTDEELEEMMAIARSGTRDDRTGLFKVLIGDEVMDGPFGLWIQGEGEHATGSIPQHGATALGAGFVGANVLADYILGKKVLERFSIKT